MPIATPQPNPSAPANPTHGDSTTSMVTSWNGASTAPPASSPATPSPTPSHHPKACSASHVAAPGSTEPAPPAPPTATPTANPPEVATSASASSSPTLTPNSSPSTCGAAPCPEFQSFRVSVFRNTDLSTPLRGALPSHPNRNRYRCRYRARLEHVQPGDRREKTVAPSPLSLRSATRTAIALCALRFPLPHSSVHL
jgi:hypothetical protein